MNETKEGFERLPLRLAWDFLRERGFEGEAAEIRASRDKYRSYDTTLKRGKVVALLESKSLLSEFIDACWPQGKTENGNKELRKYRRVYDGFMGAGTVEEEENEDEENTIESAFAYENDLRDYLSRNLYKIEAGMKLYRDAEGKEGIEYGIDPEGRRVDILALDSAGIPVVIELKVSRGHEKVIGQALYYRNTVKSLLHSDRARIVIIAREISPQLRIAAEGLSDCLLFEYELSVNLKRL